MNHDTFLLSSHTSWFRVSKNTSLLSYLRSSIRSVFINAYFLFLLLVGRSCFEAAVKIEGSFFTKLLQSRREDRGEASWLTSSNQITNKNGASDLYRYYELGIVRERDVFYLFHMIHYRYDFLLLWTFLCITQCGWLVKLCCCDSNMHVSLCSGMVRSSQQKQSWIKRPTNVKVSMFIYSLTLVD